MVDSKDNAKFNTLYKQMFEEVSEELGLKKAVAKFKQIQFSYLTNLDKFFHKKCASEFEWVEKNSTFKDGKMEPLGSIDKKEYELKTNQLNQCIQKNDKGLTNAVVDFEKEFNDFNDKISKDVAECYKRKEDNEIKQCIRDKLVKGSKELLGVFGKYEITFKKLNDNIKR